MSRFKTRTTGPILGALCSLAVGACVGAGRESELGVYDQEAQRSKVEEDAASSSLPTQPDAGPPEAKPSGTASPSVESDASAKVETDAGQATSPDAGGAPGLSFSPLAQLDPELRCYRFLAHAAGDSAQRYSVRPTPDEYVDFTFRAPWQGTQYVRSLRAIIDEKQIIHRYRLFANASATPEGVAPSDRSHVGAGLVAAWAPNGDDVYFESNSGMRVSGDVSYTLEVHYNNLTAGALPDGSGIELCVTPREPQFVLGLSLLGGAHTEGDSVTSVCSVESSAAVQVVALQPQFDAKAKHLDVAVGRSGGGGQSVLDLELEFDYQRSYEAALQLAHGDTLTATCARDGEAPLGPAVRDSACNLYVYHWPARALVSGDAVTSPNGLDTCNR